MKYVELDDIRIAFNECGISDAPTLLLLHGNSESKALFEAYQVQHFANFHTFALDSRQHGDSISNDSSLSIELMADDVIGFCERLNIRRTYVIGYSDGGNVALFLAKKCPCVFEKAVAISPNYLASGLINRYIWQIKPLWALLKLLQWAGFPLRRRIMLLELMLNDIGLTDNDLRGINTRMLILYAQHDVIKEEHFRRMAALIPNVELLKISGCSHFSILQDMEAIAAMQNFFNS